MGAALGAAVLSGCGADGVDDPALTEGPDGADDGSGGEPGGMPGQPDATPTDPLARCMERSNQGAAELLAHIDTIVILCMENRSFDHYLGALSLVEGRGDIAGLTGAESNPDSAGAPVGIFPLETYTQADPPHKWEDAHEQWNNGLNDGFVRIHNGEAMGYFTRDHLPVLYALSDGAA
ncbi:MAG: alkaline phosphatase family protein, partial [Myxococcota bacterium]